MDYAATPRFASESIGKQGKDVFKKRGHPQVSPKRTSAFDLKPQLPSRTSLYIKRPRHAEVVFGRVIDT